MEIKPPNPNRARDHLANERTYLAWIRTAVAFLGIGIVVVRLRYLMPPQAHHSGQGWQLGLFFCLAGLLLVVFATAHYFHVQNAIESEVFEPEKHWILLCSLVIGLIAAGVIYYLYISPPLPPSALP